jgi:hypothetical protein
MSILFANNAVSILGRDVAQNDNLIHLYPGDGVKFPNPFPPHYFMVVIDDGADNIEVCKCLERNGDALVVERAQESTPAQDFPAGTACELRLTKETLEAFYQITGGTLSGNMFLDGNKVHGGIIDDVTIRNSKILNTVEIDTYAGVPIGGIIMWSGDEKNIPDKWMLCDGSEPNVPDLRNRFIFGAGKKHNAHATGGSHDATTEMAGRHNHTGKTGEVRLTRDQLPAFTLEVDSVAAPRYNAPAFPVPDLNVLAMPGRGTKPFYTNRVGRNKPHDHDISDDGDHTHNVTGIQPPFYALCFIIKVR